MTERIHELADRHLRDALSEAEKHELAALLDSDPVAAREFIRATELDAALHMVCNEVASQEAGSELEKSTLAGLRRPPSPIRTFLPWLIAVAACLLAVFTQLRPLPPAVPGPGPVVALSPPNAGLPVMAVMVNEANAGFQPERAPGMVTFGAGPIVLTKGVVHLRFTSGVDFVMEAPASLDIIDAMNTRLRYGRVRAVVPPSAHGFVVATDNVQYEDIGTEFGVRVDGGTGNSALHVFEGQVNVRKPESHDLLRSVTKGQSAGYADGTPTAVNEDIGTEFRTPGEIGFLRWQAWSVAMKADPNLVAYYPFIPAEGVLDLLPDASSSNDNGGRISGARWVSGRWPGKKALLFDRDNDFAEIELPGDYRNLSISVWMNIDHFDRVLSAILDSNGWTPGAIHLQVTRQGSPYVDIATTRELSKAVTHNKEIQVHPGRWTHLATTISLDEKLARVYVDGEMAWTTELKADGRLHPGICRLGNWLRQPGDNYEPVRSMTGRIDEVAVWNRILTPAEIAAQVEAGRPDLLWTAGGSPQSK